MKLGLTNILAIFYFLFWLVHDRVPFKIKYFIWIVVVIYIAEFVVLIIMERLSSNAKLIEEVMKNAKK